jgi:GAF domain-containing protein
VSNSIQDSLTALSLHLVDRSPMSETLMFVCREARAVLPSARYVSISMLKGRELTSSMISDEQLHEIDDAQNASGDGPCVAAFRTGERVYLTSTRGSGPYPEFRSVAFAHGVKSVLSLPMTPDGDVLGLLNLYSESEDAFTTEIETGELFAAQAGVLIANSQAYWEARSLGEHLAQAMASRAEIEQAKGIIMGATGLSPDEAFDQLREQSQHENVKVREIAAEIVRRAQRARRS